MGDESNHEAFRALIPELGLLAEEDAQEETDIVNTLFTRSDALRFVKVLLSHPDLGSDHRIININKPGMRAFHQRLWADEIAYEFYPFGDWDPLTCPPGMFPIPEVGFGTEQGGSYVEKALHGRADHRAPSSGIRYGPVRARRSLRQFVSLASANRPTTGGASNTVVWR